MKKIKIYNVLGKLSEKELKDFGLFIQSPYFNKSDSIISLYAYITKYHPHFTHKNLEEVNLIKHLGLKQSNANSALAKLNTQLFKLFELYIPIKGISEYDRDSKMLEFYSTNRLNNLFTNKWSNVLKNSNKIKVKGPKFYFEDFMLQSQYGDFISSRVEKGEGDNNLIKRAEALDKHYYINKMIIACLKKNRQKSAKVDFEFNLLSEVREEIKNLGLLDEPSFALWYKTLHLLENPDDRKVYDEIKDLLFTDHSKVPLNEVKNLYVYLINTARHLFSQTDSYFQELFTIHKNQYENGYLHTNDFIGANDLVNFVSISGTIGEFDYVEKFLKENRKSIAPEYQEQEDVYELAQAIIAYYKKDYDLLLDLLNEIKCVNIYRKLRERRLRLVAYYEAGLNSLFDDLINSFRKYLSVNKDSLPEFHLQANRDCVNTAQSLFKIVKSDTQKLDALKTEIEDIRILPLRSWFLDKIAEKK